MPLCSSKRSSTRPWTVHRSSDSIISNVFWGGCVRVCTLVIYRRPSGPVSYCFVHCCVAILFDYLLASAVRDFTLSSWPVGLCWSDARTTGPEIHENIDWKLLPESLSVEARGGWVLNSSVILSYQLSVGHINCGPIRRASSRRAETTGPFVDGVVPSNIRYR